MIPNIIHQTWKTKELPENFLHWHNVVKELHPGWDVRLWTDEDNLKLVAEHFPQMLSIYQGLEYNIMRADMIRYMYMAVYGGYYLDLDYELFVPFNNEAGSSGLLLPLSREDGKDGKNILGNCIFGSVPHHPFWDDVLADLQQHPPLAKIKNKLQILELTGPSFITKIYFRNPQKYKGTLSLRHIFHPSSDMGAKKNYKEILMKNGSHGIHHCEGSWLTTKNPVKYLVSKIHSKLYGFKKDKD